MVNGVSRVTSMLRRQFLVKASSALPLTHGIVGGVVPHSLRTKLQHAAARTRPMCPSIAAHSSAQGQRTHNGSARATAIEQKHETADFNTWTARKNIADASAHADAPLYDKSARPAYPLLLHALDTYQPWMDSDVSNDLSMATRTQRMSPERSHGADDQTPTSCFTPPSTSISTTPDLSTSIVHLAVNATERILDVVWGDGHKSHFHLIWLRDHDYVDVNATNQRATDTASIPLNIMASEVKLTHGGRQLEVTWDVAVQGVRSSCFSTEWLRRHCYLHEQRVRRSLSPPIHQWGSELVSLLPELSVPYQEVMTDDAALLRVLRLVHRYGVALVSATPVNTAASQQVVERIGPVRQTIYGGFWETRVLPSQDTSHIDSAFSTCALPAHTDGNYWRDPPGLQVFHCLQADANGGETLLVDGFQVAQNLQENNPSALRLLSTTPVAFQHRDRDNHMVAYHTVVGTDALGTVNRFSLNTLDRDRLSLPREEVAPFYSAWHALCQEVRKGSNEAWLKLHPGTLIILNNRRVLHGRSSISAGSSRVLCGCYVSYEDYTSRLSVLEHALSETTHS